MKIAIIGQARSGKDTVAKYLVKKYGYTEFKFSTGIHDVINLIRGEQKSYKQRKELQEVGQGLRKALGADIWIDYTLRKIPDYLSRVVISDCRQENEYHRLKAEGFIFIEVISDREIRVQRMQGKQDKFQVEDLDHETEQIHIKGDYIIQNNGSLDELYTQIIDLGRVLSCQS